MKKEKKTKPYVEPYFEEMHRKGIILTIISLILFVGVPTITCIVYDIMPNFGTVIATGIGLIAIFVPTGIAEMFGEVPIMGSSYYLACLTGNILNLKLPSAINAIKVSGFKQGTKEADVVVGIAIAVSSLITLVILALGVILLMPLESFMTSEAIGIAASNVLPALFGCLVLVILQFTRCKSIGFAKIISRGAPSMWGFLVLAGCVYGFGQVVSKSAAIQPVQEWVLGLSLNPYITAMISVAIIAGLCADGIAAMMVWLPMFGQPYLDMGVNAGALRRLLLCTTQTFDSLPHNSAIVLTLSYCGVTHKEGYKHLFVVTVVTTTLATIVNIIMAHLGVI